MKILSLKKKYEGLGFVESLIALTVSGIVGIVLMQITASTLQKLHQLDLQDAIAMHAVSTGVYLQKIATEDMTRDDKVFDDLIGKEGICFGIRGEDSGIDMEKSGVNNRNLFKDSSLVEPDSEYFRYFCVEKIDTEKAILRVIAGSNKAAGLATSDNDTKDYSYLVVINR